MPKILCIEDEQSLRQVLVEELQDAGYETVEAEDGREGLDAIQRENPDLVISDIRMPNMDGHQLLHRLRNQHPEHADLPFLFLSAHGDRQDIITGRKLGADAYLTKPVDYELLLVEVESRLAQVTRMARHKEEELIRLYKALKTQPDSATTAQTSTRANVSVPAGCALWPVFAESGAGCPMALLAREGAGALTPTFDLETLETAGGIIRADLEADLRRFMIVDLHYETANQTGNFEHWCKAYSEMPRACRNQLGVRIVGLDSSRVLSLANGLVKRMADYSRVQFVEVGNHGLEVLTEMAQVPRFVSIDAERFAEPSPAIRRRVCTQIEALRGKRAKLLVRGCSSLEARQRNRDLMADFYC